MQRDSHHLQHPRHGSFEHRRFQDEPGIVEKGGDLLRQCQSTREGHNLQQFRMPLQKNE